MMTRGDVQEWLAEIERKSAEEQKEATANTLFWAKVAAWAGIAVRQQDSSKIPGQPGNKSGPSVRPPSEAK